MGKRRGVKIKVSTRRKKPVLSSGKGGFNTYKLAEIRRKQISNNG